MKRWISLMTTLALLAVCSASCAYADGGTALCTDVAFSKADLNAAWDENAATRVALTGDGAVVTGEGAAFTDGVLTVSLPGDYVLSGALSGSVVVDIDKEEKARLILNGVEIDSQNAPAIHIKSADKVTLTLADGTVNTLTDTAAYALAQGEDEPNACLFSKEDLSINGGGALVIAGNYRHGVNCKDDLRIAGGEITVSAVEDGVRGRDSVAVAGGALSVACGGDGIRSSNDEEDGKGLIALSGGGITVVSGSDGLHAAQRLQITGGSLTVTCGEGAGDASSDGYTSSRGGWDSWGNWDMSGGDDGVSMKGLKSDGDLIVVGGDIAVDSEDDSLHAAGNITVADGDMILKSGDDGMHSDATVIVTGGKIDVQTSYEGVEGACITISGGVLSVVASDDGLNAAGDMPENATEAAGDMPEDATEAADVATAATLAPVPPDGGVLPDGETPPELPADETPRQDGQTPPELPAGESGRQAQNARGGRGTGAWGFAGRGGMMAEANEQNILLITGGSVYVNASGDGLDANGYIRIEGGTVVVDGPDNSGNGALDPGYGAVVTGGVLIAAGATGMEATPDSSSTQPVLYAQASLNAGDLFAVTDESGALICAFTAVKNHSSVIVSAPGLTLGAACALYKGGAVDGEADNGLYLSGAYADGEKLADVTLTDIVTTVGGGGGWTNRFNRRGW